ncbi:hypothetical protein BT96DRAFT_1013817 [Gymnopus androsaceus JB14]|uniref:Uncharacterized protein n=1 Tax=Gymnopus androsaceus JB14 TaxID=1447944 RepID=A0A6A4ID49_9AGAR|nr:hypothetical protein BT96DRAFT_1013817 [Gymnopus androsaceus JB14]
MSTTSTDVSKKEESPSEATKEPKEDSAVTSSEDSTAKDSQPPVDDSREIQPASDKPLDSDEPRFGSSTNEDKEEDWNSDQEPVRPEHMPRGRINPPVARPPPPRPK